MSPPYRIGLSSYNGMIDGELYSDSIEVNKFTIFNKEIALRTSHLKISNKGSFESLDLLNYTAKDILSTSIIMKNNSESQLISEKDSELNVNETNVYY